MKQIILDNKEKYIIKDERLKQLLLQIRESGKQSFLLTNSDYSYTNVSYFESHCSLGSLHFHRNTQFSGSFWEFNRCFC